VCAISLLRSTDGRHLSYVAGARDDAGRLTRWVQDIWKINSLGEDICALRAIPQTWFRPGASLYSPLPWGRALYDLRERLCSLINALRAGVNWVMLAVDPELASLPLMELLRSKLPAGAVVTIVPSLSWISRVHIISARSDELARDASHIPTIVRLPRAEEFIRLGDHEDLGQLYNRAEELRERILRNCTSTVVILGHGLPGDNGALNRVVANGMISGQDWKDYFTRRLMIVNSCWAAEATPMHVGTLGGLVGMAMMRRTRAFLAPLVEASPQAVKAVLEKIPEYSTVGDCYLASIQEERSASVYCLYGDPNVSL
jgi:hypothetical protein